MTIQKKLETTDWTHAPCRYFEQDSKLPLDCQIQLVFHSIEDKICKIEAKIRNQEFKEITISNVVYNKKSSQSGNLSDLPYKRTVSKCTARYIEVFFDKEQKPYEVIVETPK